MSAIHDLFSHYSMDMDLMLAIRVLFSHYSVELMSSTSIFVQIFIIYSFVQPFHEILTSIFFVIVRVI
jgi:ABC-type arginine/histidine transport system permease subunit